MGRKFKARAKARRKSVSEKQAKRKKAQSLMFTPDAVEACDSVLLVGEGDFSFALDIAEARKGRSILATTLDSEADSMKQHRRCSGMTKRIKALGGEVAFGVDATKLKATLPRHRRGEQWDCIMWVCPHSGEQRVHVNRGLLRKFFAAAGHVVTDDGNVIVVLKDGLPYSEWNVKEQAESEGFSLSTIVPFDEADFPSYGHVTTVKGAKRFRVDSTRMKAYIFALETRPEEVDLMSFADYKAAVSSPAGAATVPEASSSSDDRDVDVARLSEDEDEGDDEAYSSGSQSQSQSEGEGDYVERDVSYGEYGDDLGGGSGEGDGSESVGDDSPVSDDRYQGQHTATATQTFTTVPPVTQAPSQAMANAMGDEGRRHMLSNSRPWHPFFGPNAYVPPVTPNWPPVVVWVARKDKAKSKKGKRAAV